MNDSQVSRFKGCLLGGAIGDAMGAPVEFMSLQEIRRRFGHKGISDLAAAYGRVGAITDDTQMTMWTAEGLLRGHCRGTLRGILWMPGMVHRAYLRWLKTQGLSSEDESFFSAIEGEASGWLIHVQELHARRSPGNTCLDSLASSGVGTMEKPKNNSKGCGGVMRVAPVGLYEQNPGRSFQLACELAAITHGHPSGYLSAGCLAAIIAGIMGGADIREAVDKSLEILEGKPRHGETSTCIRHAISLLDSGDIPSSETVGRIGQGWIAEEALAISVYCAIAHTHDFRRAVLLAVNHSGDSDSTGAIAGNILGAFLGVDAIPSEWLERLELRSEIEMIAADLHTQFCDDDEWWSKYPGC